ncbi:hypothetical protein Hanom_Chr09g00788721 [Helianthus anomalus]
MEKVGHGKVLLKKKPQKKRKGSDDEVSTYTPTVAEKKKLRIKRKAVQTAVIPRNVRAKKGGATMPEGQRGKSEKHVTTSMGPEAVKDLHVEVSEVPEIQSVEKPEVQKKAGADDDVVITEVRVSTPPPPENPEFAESSKPKKTILHDLFEGFPNIHGEYKDDILSGEEFDVFHDASVKDLKKKMSFQEKEKEKAEVERDELKKQLEALSKVNEEIKSVLIKHVKKIKNMEGDVHDNTQLFEQLSMEITDLHLKNKKLNEINQMLNQLISELHEASTNEFKAMKLEMEALRADKEVKDEQLNMLYTTMEQHLDAEVDPKGFVLVGDSTPLSYNFDDLIHRVQVEQRKRKAKEPEVLFLIWKEEEEEEKEDEELEDVLDAVDNYDPSWDDFIDKKDDDDQGSMGLLIVNPSVQQKIYDFMNDEINEQEDDQQQESSSSGKKHADQVFLKQPTVIYLNALVEGEIEVPRSRAEILEELGLDDGNFKFDIEDEIPLSPEKEYEFKYVHEADNYTDVIVEEGSDSSDEETVFHYSGVDEMFPTLAELFKEQNEEEVRRKVVEKITTEGIPRTIPRENLVEERKK